MASEKPGSPFSAVDEALQRNFRLLQAMADLYHRRGNLDKAQEIYKSLSKMKAHFSESHPSTTSYTITHRPS